MKTKKVIKFLGGRGAKAKLARLFNISRAAVSKWGVYVPKERVKVLLETYPALAGGNTIPQVNNLQNIKNG